MSDYNTQTPPRSSGLPPNEPARSSSLSPMVFIVGGLVVAVGVLFWVMSGDAGVTTTPDSTDTSISIDNSAAPAVDTAPATMDAAPADDAVVEPAPAAPDAAPDAAPVEIVEPTDPAIAPADATAEPADQ